MPSILWAFLSFVAGWCLLGFFRLMMPPEPTTTPVLPQNQPVPPEPAPEVPAELYRQVLGSIRSALQGGGWEASVTLPPDRPAEDQPAPPISDGLRKFLLFLGLVLGLGLFFLAMLQYREIQGAFDFEDFVATQRAASVCGWMAVGFVASAYRDSIPRIWKSLFNVISNKDDTVLWPVQAALALGLFIGTLLAINPQLVEKITSFKAAGVEADFNASSSRIVNAPVKYLDVSQRVTLSGWANFKILNVNWAGIDWTNQASLDWNSLKRIQEKEEVGYRETVYNIAGAGFWRAVVSQYIFDRQLTPIFSEIQCFEELDDTELVQNDDELNEYVVDFANFIKKSVNGESNPALASRILVKLQKKSRMIWINFHERIRGKLGDYPSTASVCVNELHSELCSNEESTESFCRKMHKHKSDTNALEKTYENIYEEGYYEHLLSHLRSASGSRLWDLYVVSAVADLIAFTSDERSRAEFLERIRDAGVDRFASCDNQCLFVIPSVTSFYNYIDDAKVKSGMSWPMDESISDMRSALVAIDTILDSGDEIKSLNRIKEPKPDIRFSDWQIQDMQNHYRYAKFSDLSLGLEIFYQRALAGEVIGEADSAQWSAWLKETQQILSVVEGVGVSPDLRDASSWRQARTLIDQDQATVFDAATSTALSLVLIPSVSGKPTSADCLAAKSILNYAKTLTYSRAFRAVVAPHAEQAAPLRGLVGEIGDRIDSECRT